MTTEDVIEALRCLHPASYWVTWRECLRIDFFAVNTSGGWPATPTHRRIAYEVKVSRSDFSHEIARPEKRQQALDLSSEFYFACPEGLIREHEVPNECGLVYVGARRPVVVRRAPTRETRPFTDAEAIYLARYPLYREGIEADRIALRQARAELARLKQARYGSEIQKNQGTQSDEAPAHSLRS